MGGSFAWGFRKDSWLGPTHFPDEQKKYVFFCKMWNFALTWVGMLYKLGIL